MKNSYFLILLSIFVGCEAADNMCMYIDYRGNNSKVTQRCSQNELCKRNYKVSSINLPPYSTANLLEKIVHKCCGHCVNFTYINFFKNITEVTLHSINTSDFIMPFVAKSSAVSLYGYHFIPLVDVPTAFYITPKNKSVLESLILKCLNLYPLIVICLLMAIISGFIAWSLETWYNKEEFPRTFLTGLFEGFWWSFVSMTTVGYGDKTIKSIPARLFSVIWILIGIAMFGLLTGLLTTEILKAGEPHNHIFMEGSNIGALKFRDYDASLIVKQGGIVKESKSAWNFNSDMFMLISMLRNEDINGIIIDKYTLAYITEYFAWKKGNIDNYLKSEKHPMGEKYTEREDDIIFFKNYTFKTQKSYDGDKLCYGTLVKDKEVYNYFRAAIQDNRLPLDTSVGSELNKIFPKTEKIELFTSHGEHFLNTTLVLLGILCFICLFGVVYELYTRKKLIFVNKESPGHENTNIVSNTDIELCELYIGKNEITEVDIDESQDFCRDIIL